MIDVLENKNCSGCTACMTVCREGAIVMRRDWEGFLYPVVEIAKCVECGACEKVCPAIQQPEFHATADAYAVQLRNKDVLKKCQSGGAFWALADCTFDRDGVAYGAALDANLRVVYQRAETRKRAEEFHGSKYVQADMGIILPQVKADVIAGRQVLFSGTACHIAGLIKYLGKNYDNLYTCDLICHGVPSPMLLEKYIEYMCSRYNASVVKFHFGYYDAENGYRWNDPRRERIEFSNRKIYEGNKYIRSFASNWCIRPYCYICPYARPERISDFTIGDFWGVEKHTSIFETQHGVSVLFFNNDKARMLFPDIAQKTIIEAQEIENIVAHQHNLKAPSFRNKRRDKIINTLICSGFAKAYQIDRAYYYLYLLKSKLLGGERVI